MDERTLKTLDLESLVALLARHVQTPLGRKRVMALVPSTDRNHINGELDRTTECFNYLFTGGSFGLSDVADPDDSMAELQVQGTSLEPLQILALQRLISVGMDLREQFGDLEIRSRYPHLTAIAGRVPDLRRMLASMRGKILPTGEVDDSASPVLR